MAAALLAAPTVFVGSAASATSHNFAVNSLGQAGATADSLANGVCLSTAGTCTLRAAIEVSNAIGGTGDVTITVADVDASGQPFAGGVIPLTNTTATWMQTTTISTGGTITGDSGAYLVVTAPVTIDLAGKIKLQDSNVTGVDSANAAVFYLNGPDITVRGVNDSYSSETTFYVGPNAARVTIADGSASTPNTDAERFLVVRGGASAVTLSNYTITGYAGASSIGSSPREGWVLVDGAVTTPVTDLVVDNNTFTIGTVGGACSPTTAVGCTSPAVNFNAADGERVTGFRFTNNYVYGINQGGVTWSAGIDMGRAKMTNTTITGNTFENNKLQGADTNALIEMGNHAVTGTSVINNITISGNGFYSMSTGGADGEMSGVIRFPGRESSLTGTAIVSHNYMQATPGKFYSQGIYWSPTAGTAMKVTSTGLTISDNFFDGFSASPAGRTSMRLWGAGAVDFSRNRAGVNSQTQTNTVFEEYHGLTVLEANIFSNYSMSANGMMNTWFPTARTNGNVQADLVESVGCVVPLEVAPPTDSQAQAYSLARMPDISGTTLDVFWTASNTAEVYVGTYTLNGTNARQTINVGLPMPGDPRLAFTTTYRGEERVITTAGPVDPVTGEVSGYLRVQTHDSSVGATAASSQYSRVARIKGNCSPSLTIDQAAGQNDDTMGRDLHFTITSTMPLDPASVSTDDITVAATATADTIDASRLNPRVVSVTEVAGSNGTKWDVVVRVDDSATVTASVAAGTMANLDGRTNVAPSTSTDNTITFVNPLQATPAQFTLVTGEPDGKSYVLSVKPTAPMPRSALYFTATVEQPPGTPAVLLSTQAPVIMDGLMQSDQITVTAAAGDVEANTQTTVSHTVTSEDANYDGLVVPSVYPYLFSTDPAIKIEKKAYVAREDGTPFNTSSAAQIVATGTQAPEGSRLTDREAVCFVYTVTNTSADDWPTTLMAIKVTDTDKRLGTGGLIDTIHELGIGASTQVFACTSLTPVDTTASDVPTDDEGE